MRSGPSGFEKLCPNRSESDGDRRRAAPREIRHWLSGTGRNGWLVARRSGEALGVRGWSGKHLNVDLRCVSRQQDADCLSTRPNAGECHAPDVPPALLAQARLDVRDGVSLDTVLRRYFAGNALFEDFLVEEAERAEVPNSALRRSRCSGRRRRIRRP